MIDAHLTRPVGRPPKRGIQVKLVDFRYRAQTWDRERRVVAKIEWHAGELFPRIGFIVTNSRLRAGKVRFCVHDIGPEPGNGRFQVKQASSYQYEEQRI